ncbi:hypothetical protein ACI3ER_11800 [Bacillus sp. Wb]
MKFRREELPEKDSQEIIGELTKPKQYSSDYIKTVKSIVKKMNDESKRKITDEMLNPKPLTEKQKQFYRECLALVLERDNKSI